MSEKNDFKNGTNVNGEYKLNVEEMTESEVIETSKKKMKMRKKMYVYGLIVFIVITLIFIGLYIRDSLNNKNEITNENATDIILDEQQSSIINEEFGHYFIIFFFFIMHLSLCVLLLFALHFLLLNHKMKIKKTPQIYNTQ